MRIPFDLLAALLALESVSGLYQSAHALAVDPKKTTTSQAFLGLLGFWLVVWLMQELLARRVEWQTRWGLWPQGVRPVSTPGGVRYAPSRRHPLDVHARNAMCAQFFAVAVYAGFIYGFAWPIMTMDWPYWLGLHHVFSLDTCEALGQGRLVNGVLGLGPFAVAVVIALIPKYRLLVMETGRSDGIWKWLSFEMRLTFPPLLLWLLMYACWDVTSWLAPAGSEAFLDGHPWLIVVLAGLVLALFGMAIMPWMMIRLWHARPMADREARDRLAALLKRSGVKARAILEWGPRGTGFANACVLGPWAPFRYILISPGLMRLLSPEECEAVIAHEIGHVRHGHLGLLLFVVLGMAAWSDLILRALEARGYADPITQGLVLMLLVVIYLRVLFGVVSRRCERQADLAAAELMGTPSSLISALEKLAMLSGGTREVYSWHHDSIARRVTRLQTEGVDPEAIRRYHRSLRPMRLSLLGMSAIAVGWMLWFALTDPVPADKKAAEGSVPTSVQKEGRSSVSADAADPAGVSDPSDRPDPSASPQGGPKP